MRTRTRALAIALIALGLLQAYVVVALALTAAPGPVSERLAAEGAPFVRAQTSTSLALLLSAQRPAAVVIVGAPRPAMDEMAPLASYVQEGGSLWLLAPDPAASLGPRLGAGIATLPGRIYASNGSVPTLAGGDDAFAQGGARALETGALWSPVFATSPEAFRDVDGDGRLSTGEPAGPFVVGARRALGEGTLTVIALDARQAAPSAGLMDAMRAQLPAGTWLVADAPSAPAWAAPALALARAEAILGTGGPAALLATFAAGASIILIILRRPARPRAGGEAVPEETADAWLRELHATSPEQHARIQALVAKDDEEATP